MKKTFTDKLITAMICMLFSMTVFICMPTVSMAYTQATGIVSADAAKVRKEPSTTSDVVVGLLKGSTVTVTDEVTDSAGMLWYKVSVDSSNGYIRSDLMIKAATSTGTNDNNLIVNTNNNSVTVNQGATNKPSPTVATPIAETKAYVNFESARIREGASTNHDIAGSASKNTSVTITGEAKGSDGKLWYEIKYTTSAGRDVVGFIRSDLLTIGDPPAETPPPEAPVEEENTDAETENLDIVDENAEGDEAEAPEETEAPEPEEEQEETKPDYEMVYTQNNEGENEWYLYDNINGTRQTLAGLMAAAEAGASQGENDSEQFSTQKIIIIVLAVIVAILAVTVTLLLFKIKDFYDDDYDDEDDDEDDDDEDDDEDEEEEIPVRRKRTKTVKPMRALEERAEREPLRSVESDSSNIRQMSKEPINETPVQPKRKAKNFLIDDDEFEFEFLNIDDRD